MFGEQLPTLLVILAILIIMALVLVIVLVIIKSCIRPSEKRAESKSLILGKLKKLKINPKTNEATVTISYKSKNPWRVGRVTMFRQTLPEGFTYNPEKEYVVDMTIWYGYSRGFKHNIDISSLRERGDNYCLEE